MASRTLGLVINSLRNKLSINSLLLEPEHRHAMLLRFADPLEERKIVRRRFSLAVAALDTLDVGAISQLLSVKGCFRGYLIIANRVVGRRHPQTI
jgi:hypothetical protein